MNQTCEIFVMFPRKGKNHERFDSDIKKTDASAPVSARGGVPLADVGIVPAVGLTAGCGFFFAAEIDRLQRLPKTP